MRYTSYERGWCNGIKNALSGPAVITSDDFAAVLRDALAFLGDMDFIIVDSVRRAYVSACDCDASDTAETAPWRALPEWAAVHYG